MDLKIGADPEVFVRQGGVNVSGHEMIPGTKKKPHAVKHGAVQVDGTALEFNIEPASTQEEFVRNIKEVMAQLKQMIPADAELDISAVARYEAQYFANLPKVAKELGCDPDFDAYTGAETERKAGERPFRTAAGHIHIGWTNNEDPYIAKHFQSCRTLVKDLDIWLGLPSVIFDPESKDRRDLYGKAGCFRPKHYGVEYRVLSNKWLQSDELTGWAFNQTKAAFDWLMGGNGPLNRHVSAKQVQKAINESNVELAKALLTNLGIEGLKMPDGTDFVRRRAPKKEDKGRYYIKGWNEDGPVIEQVAADPQAADFHAAVERLAQALKQPQGE